MGLRDIIAAGVAIANNATKDLQVAVTHFQWIAQTGFGAPTYDTPFAEGIPRKAIVEQGVKQRFSNLSSKMVTFNAHILFLVPFEPNGAIGRVEPIDPRDKFVLADGTTGPIVDIQGFTDSKTGRPYFGEVWLGPTGAV